MLMTSCQVYLSLLGWQLDLQRVLRTHGMMQQTRWHVSYNCQYLHSGGQAVSLYESTMPNQISSSGAVVFDYALPLSLKILVGLLLLPRLSSSF